MQQAALLLLIIESFPRDEGMITGKLYEYLAAGHPVLGIGPPGGDASTLLQQTDAGQLFDRDDAEGIAQFIEAQYAAWSEGNPASGAKPEVVHQYSRRAQAERLAALLDRIQHDQHREP